MTRASSAAAHTSSSSGRPCPAPTGHPATSNSRQVPSPDHTTRTQALEVVNSTERDRHLDDAKTAGVVSTPMTAGTRRQPRLVDRYARRHGRSALIARRRDVTGRRCASDRRNEPPLREGIASATAANNAASRRTATPSVTSATNTSSTAAVAVTPYRNAAPVLCRDPVFAGAPPCKNSSSRRHKIASLGVRLGPPADT